MNVLQLLRTTIHKNGTIHQLLKLVWMIAFILGVLCGSIGIIIFYKLALEK